MPDSPVQKVHVSPSFLIKSGEKRARWDRSYPNEDHVARVHLFGVVRRTKSLKRNENDSMTGKPHMNGVSELLE